MAHIQSDSDADEGPGVRPSKAPAFQFYPSDFIGSSKVQRMTLAERGAYITLLSFAWMDAGLPTDLAALGRMVGMGKAAFAKMWSGPMSECFVEQNGRYVNLKQEQIRKAQEEFRQRQRSNAAKGWHSRGIAVASERHMPNACSPSPSPSSSSTSKSERAPTPRTMGAGVMGGTLQRDHLGHAWCGQTFRVCVPHKLHGDLSRRLGGETPGTRLEAFYASVESALDPSVPVTENIFRFWERQFAAVFGGATLDGKPDPWAFAKQLDGGSAS